jgi:cyclic-di-GMP phosphodiesterase TipF (flagellum assembly factor)
MSALKHGIIVIAYGLVAVMAALVLPIKLPALGTDLGVTCGVALFMVSALLHQYLAKTERDGVIDEQIDGLYAAYDKLAEDIDLLREEARTARQGFARLSDGVEQRAEEQAEKIAAEVRVLKNLVAELSAGRTVEQESRAARLRVVGERPARAKPAKPATRPIRTNLDQAQVLDIVRDGLRRDRVDLFLQPIVSLPQRKPRFYECFSRIRDKDGAMVVPEQYLDIAKREGLLRAIDNMLLFRCVQLVRKAQRHRHNLGFFCNISVQSLSDRAFFAEFTDFMSQNRELTAQLTFELATDDVLSQWDEVAPDLFALARLGFYFSMDRVQTLDFDPTLLARRRFRFVKIEADTLLESGADIRAFKRDLDRSGIDLIVEKIENEQQLVELLDHNIDFGQGFLFGEPRLSREG